MLVQILVIPLVREQKSLQSLSLSSMENQDIEIYIYIYIYIYIALWKNFHGNVYGDFGGIFDPVLTERVKFVPGKKLFFCK
jgi:hypothetical protein